MCAFEVAGVPAKPEERNDWQALEAAICSKGQTGGRFPSQSLVTFVKHVLAALLVRSSVSSFAFDAEEAVRDLGVEAAGPDVSKFGVCLLPEEAGRLVALSASSTQGGGLPSALGSALASQEVLVREGARERLLLMREFVELQWRRLTQHLRVAAAFKFAESRRQNLLLQSRAPAARASAFSSP